MVTERLEKPTWLLRGFVTVRLGKPTWALRGFVTEKVGKFSVTLFSADKNPTHSCVACLGKNLGLGSEGVWGFTFDNNYWNILSRKSVHII